MVAGGRRPLYRSSRIVMRFVSLLGGDVGGWAVGVTQIADDAWNLIKSPSVSLSESLVSDLPTQCSSFSNFPHDMINRQPCRFNFGNED